MWKKWRWMLLGIVIAQFFAGGQKVDAKEVYLGDYREITGAKMTQEMGAGWNLGNTMDGHTELTPSETAWQDVKTTQKLIKSVHDMGFETLRIPVTWGTMIEDANGYTIKKEWIQRVNEIVDYAMKEGMYVIINIHHDGADGKYWLNATAADMKAVYQKFGGVWTSIAEQFKDYDEHLIFESMNEVYGGDTEISKLNQTFVDAVRKTGGNNALRWLSIPGSGANIGAASQDFLFPKDIVQNRLFFAVHYYDWSFGLEEKMDVTEWSTENSLQLYNQLKYLRKFFTKKGIPVILGEYGCIDKDNTVDRTYFDEVTTRICRNLGVVPVYWDNGYHKETKPHDYGFSLFDRKTGDAWYPEIVQGIMRGIYLEGSYKTIKKNPQIIKINCIKPSKSKIVLDIGKCETLSCENTPEKNNDVVLWKSDNEDVATVFGGKVQAVENGSTKITAFSQSGSVKSTITVQVGTHKKNINEKKNSKSKLEIAIVIAVGIAILGSAGIYKRRKRK